LVLVGARVAYEPGDRLTFEPFPERPLVRVHRPARPSPTAPEVEPHHLSPVVRQLEAHAVEVFALDLRGRLANAQVAQLEQSPAGHLAERAGARADQPRAVGVVTGHRLERLLG